MVILGGSGEVVVSGYRGDALRLLQPAGFDNVCHQETVARKERSGLRGMIPVFHFVSYGLRSLRSLKPTPLIPKRRGGLDAASIVFYPS
jgi:hypothetical protein